MRGQPGAGRSCGIGRDGGVRPARLPRRGFTLIELLIVVCIIGILSIIAIPKFANSKGKAEKAALVSDLRNLATAEEAYFYDNATYTTTIGALQYLASPGVSVTIGAANAAGWTASASSTLATPGTCAIFFGSISPMAPATTEGVIACQ
jgi:prepilin-type N-terminal cleavage/methylation domain-containing protein